VLTSCRYDDDILGEEAIIAWAKEAGHADNVFWQGVGKLVEWLEEAEEDDDSDDDDEE